MENTILITVGYLKEAQAIVVNADDKLIQDKVFTVQENYISGLLGVGLYNELKQQVSCNTVTVLNKKLLENYLQIAMKYYCMAELCESACYWMVNTAMDLDHSSPEKLQQIKQYYLNHAEWYAKRAVKYLQQNHTSYPLWLDNKLESIK